MKRYVLRIAVSVLALIFLGIAIVWAYVQQHKTDILHELESEINSRINAEVSIGGLDLSIVHSFPDISIRLSSVTVRDTLWKRHQHNLLTAEKVFVQINPFSFFSKKPAIRKIIIDGGSIYMFSDSSGYDNINILRSNPSKKNELSDLPGLGLRNLHLVIDEVYRKKLFEFNIQKLDVASITEEGAYQFHISMSVLVKRLSFNMDKGSFLKEKQVSGKIKVKFNPNSQVLQFDPVQLLIDQQAFSLSGKFFFGEKPPPFQLSLKTGNILFKNASALLPENITAKLNNYDISVPVAVTCNLDATATDARNPLIRIGLKADHATVVTPAGAFMSASFSGTFTNQWQVHQPPGDENSRLLFSGFSGIWQKIPIRSVAIAITDLDHPLLNCDLHSMFELTSLNEISGTKTIRFEKGSGRLDINYRGALQSGDSIQSEINGNIKVSNAYINYLPRAFQLTDGNGTIRFRGQDLFIEELVANAGSTRLKMSGSAQNLLSLINKDHERLLIDWTISSKVVNLRDFVSFLKKPPDSLFNTKESSTIAKTGAQIDRMLKDCSVRLQLKANQITYRKFNGSNLAATILFAYNRIELSKVLLEHAGGSLAVDGTLQNQGNSNLLDVHAQMYKVDLPKVFNAFNNFGQTAIQDKNLAGKLNADIKITGSISSDAQLDGNSLAGTVDWTLADGQLIQFEPLEKISKAVFKDRSFSDIYFAELKDRFEIKGTGIKINRMEIQSTALTMFTEGLYDLKKGADMSIQIPLSNLKSKNQDKLPVNKGISSKTGISLLLRAKTGDDGKLNVTWDPFKKALKK